MTKRTLCLLAILLACLAGTGCAARKRARVTPEAPAAAAPPAEEPPVPSTSPDSVSPPTEQEAPASSPAPAFEPAPAPAPAEPPKPRLRDLCNKPETDTALDETRRVLEETFCTAALWFDGLFGHDTNVRSARRTSGRIEISHLYTEFDGLTNRGRLRLRYDLPNLDERVNVFLGRDDRDDFIADRQEGFAIRSSVFGLDNQDRWLAGLGYSPPGRYTSKFDIRVGARIKSAPEAFVQGRYRQNVFLGDKAVWRFRETVFWENREGFGATTSADFDRVVRRDTIFRSGTVGTVSESIDGVAWRQVFLLYHNLRRSRAVAFETFVRGETKAEVELQEYGVRTIYRRPFFKPYLFIEGITGYSWPREELVQKREGSAMIGVGFELLFGRDPFSPPG